ncbi:MAG: hypothetical protein GF320_20355 [Armatimonadia bacterium]|nr:hypothetical protein [Armatimonadia bacterium]
MRRARRGWTLLLLAAGLAAAVSGCVSGGAIYLEDRTPVGTPDPGEAAHGGLLMADGGETE